MVGRMAAVADPQLLETANLMGLESRHLWYWGFASRMKLKAVTCLLPGQLYDCLLMKNWLYWVSRPFHWEDNQWCNYQHVPLQHEVSCTSCDFVYLSKASALCSPEAVEGSKILSDNVEAKVLQSLLFSYLVLKFWVPDVMVIKFVLFQEICLFFCNTVDKIIMFNIMSWNVVN